jgi:MFS transporter, SP family, solute carrier family 2 (facilitated glucose transporter), member 3
MTDAIFGAVTSSFTAGGFVGSSCASVLLEKFGRRGALVLNSLCIALGSIAFAGSSSVTGLIAARFIIGIGSGIGLCAVPLYLAETAPSRLKDKVGVLNQLLITIGILATQSIGLPLAKRSQWRPVLVVSSLIAIVHAATGIFVSDTPAWLAAKGRHSDASAVSRSLHGGECIEADPDASMRPSDSEVHTSLLPRPDTHKASIEPSSLVPPTETVGILGLLAEHDLRRALLIVSAAMIAQQGSGINAVIYYSTDILKEALSVDAASISVLISVVNVVMTFAPIMLIGKYGTKRLLFGSIVGSCVSTLLLGYGLDAGTVWLSSATILIFVASFALGLGPVPFMLTADLVPYYATSSLSSIALSLNWTANFLVGVSFLPLRNFLASIGKVKSPDAELDNTGQGRVFYVFSALLAVIGAYLSRLYRRG